MRADMPGASRRAPGGQLSARKQLCMCNLCMPTPPGLACCAREGCRSVPDVIQMACTVEDKAAQLLYWQYSWADSACVHIAHDEG